MASSSAASFKLDPAALRRSLVEGAATRQHARAPVATPPPRPSKAPTEPRVVPVADISHVYGMLYPRSLVEGNAGTSTVSLAAALRKRDRASRARRYAFACAIHATPRRTEHCEAATVAVNAAIARYHEATAAPGGDEDGTLSDVVNTSLKQSEACDIDWLDDKIE